MKRVLVFGTFDALHPGHISFLKQARKKGTRLIASVARDSYVRAHKNREPLHHEGERITNLLESGLVDEAYLSDETVGSYRVVLRSRPDVICFGHDQDKLRLHFTTWLGENGGTDGNSPEIYTMKAHKPERYKSSKIISHHRRDG